MGVSPHGACLLTSHLAVLSCHKWTALSGAPNLPSACDREATKQNTDLKDFVMRVYVIYTGGINLLAHIKIMPTPG